MIDKSINLYVAGVAYTNANHITVFDDYVGGDSQYFKITNLDSTVLTIEEILIDGVAQDFQNDPKFIYGPFFEATWVQEGDYVKVQEAGATCEFFVDCAGTAKKVTIKLGGHSQAHFARIENKVSPKKLEGTGIDLFRDAGQYGGTFMDMLVHSVYGDVEGNAVTNTNVGYKNYVDGTLALEQGLDGITKLFGKRAMTKAEIQADEVTVHVNPNGAGVMEQTFNFAEPFCGATLPVMAASVVAMDGSTANAHLWRVIPTVLSVSQFKLKVINTTNTWGTDIKVQFVASKKASTL